MPLGLRGTDRFYIPLEHTLVPVDYYLRFLRIESDQQRKEAIAGDKIFQEIAAGRCWKVSGADMDADGVLKTITGGLGLNIIESSQSGTRLVNMEGLDDIHTSVYQILRYSCP
jgi:hypothetical protein